jgi:hypothetical protein
MGYDQAIEHQLQNAITAMLRQPADSLGKHFGPCQAATVFCYFLPNRNAFTGQSTQLILSNAVSDSLTRERCVDYLFSGIDGAGSNCHSNADCHRHTDRHTNADRLGQPDADSFDHANAKHYSDTEYPSDSIDHANAKYYPDPEHCSFAHADSDADTQRRDSA